MVTEPQPEAQAGPTIPDVLPILPLRGGTVVFPATVVPLAVGQPGSVHLVDDVMQRDRLVALAAQRADGTEQPDPEGVHRLGTAGIIQRLARAPDGTLHLLVQGIERVRLLDFTATEPYLIARIEPVPDRIDAGDDVEALRRAVVDLFRRFLSLSNDAPGELAATVEALTEPRDVVYFVASVVPLSGAVRQELLELDPVEAKLRRLIELLQHELAVRELGRKITTETQERMSKSQRDYFLREQLRSIQRELGDEEDSELAELRRRLAEAVLPEEAQKEADRELGRMATIPSASPEYGIIRTYLDWIVSLPWQARSGGDIDVRRAREVLDEDHYDLEKIKDRILEYLAVAKLRQERRAQTHLASEAAGAAVGEPVVEPEPEPNVRSETPTDEAAREPILCLVGPPGVGKTSLGQSIARALGRKFVRMSLGGIHDEAEIRGHRRTYIGALPGRVIQGLQRAQTRDPVFMLDEIDKVGGDWRGDPSSALLEVLDPAQNNSFIDNYLGVPFDLSSVFFITTANTLDTIPGPLRDRMEILQLSGYTDEEKSRIAQKYLIPKQLAAHGLLPNELSLEDGAIRLIVRRYTREAGVRGLDRQIAAVCRKAAREVAEGRADPISVTPELVEEYLGRPFFPEDASVRIDRPGVATGMAWTPVGGDILFVEAALVPSREERLILTGMLGDVMRESAQAAVTWLRSNALRLGIDPALFERKTVHVHVPAGAVPKDGPSAGVTMVTALASLATDRNVKSDVAMTGEITLRGKVLPVGGIKEKVLAAHRAGIRTIILPRENERDLEDVPEELRRELEVIPVDAAEEVVAQALAGGPMAVAARTGNLSPP
jgi:ATP-dependent Lon protease